MQINAFSSQSLSSVAWLRTPEPRNNIEWFVTGTTEQRNNQLQLYYIDAPLDELSPSEPVLAAALEHHGRVSKMAVPIT